MGRCFISRDNAGRYISLKTKHITSSFGLIYTPDIKISIDPCRCLISASLAVAFTVIQSVQVRIQDLVKGGGPGSEAESCRCSEVELHKRSEQSLAGVQGP